MKAPIWKAGESGSNKDGGGAEGGGGGEGGGGEGGGGGGGDEGGESGGSTKSTTLPTFPSLTGASKLGRQLGSTYVESSASFIQ